MTVCLICSKCLKVVYLNHVFTNEQNGIPRITCYTCRQGVNASVNPRWSVGVGEQATFWLGLQLSPERPACRIALQIWGLPASSTAQAVAYNKSLSFYLSAHVHTHVHAQPIAFVSGRALFRKVGCLNDGSPNTDQPPQACFAVWLRGRFCHRLPS